MKRQWEIPNFKEQSMIKDHFVISIIK